MSENHKKMHNKADPDEENSLLHALRSARGNRADTEKRLKKELEVLLQEHVTRYLEHLDLPIQVTRAVNANRSELEVDIRSARTFFNRQLEGNLDFFCLVENQGLALKITKSWADFYNALLQRVAIKELRKSCLLMERYVNSDSYFNVDLFDWVVDSRSEKVLFEDDFTVNPHEYGLFHEERLQNGYLPTPLPCCRFNSHHIVHTEAYAYPVVLKLKWD